MAYISQEMKLKIAPRVKAVCKKYGVMGSLSIRHNMTLVLKLKSGSLDIHGNVYFLDPSVKNARLTQVNPYYLDRVFSGEVLNFFKEVKDAMNDGNHDNSDPQTDYFDIGWFIDIKVDEYVYKA